MLDFEVNYSGVKWHLPVVLGVHSNIPSIPNYFKIIIASLQRGQKVRRSQENSLVKLLKQTRYDESSIQRCEMKLLVVLVLSKAAKFHKEWKPNMKGSIHSSSLSFFLLHWHLYLKNCMLSTCIIHIKCIVLQQIIPSSFKTLGELYTNWWVMVPKLYLTM